MFVSGGSFVVDTLLINCDKIIKLKQAFPCAFRPMSLKASLRLYGSVEKVQSRYF